MPTSAHLRTSPAPDVPGVTSPRHFAFLSLLTWPYVALTILPALTHSALLYLFSPRPYPSWNLRAALRIRYNKLFLGSISGVLPPEETAEEAWTAPQLNVATGIDRSQLDIKVVKVDPAPSDLIRGIADCPGVGVEPVVRPGFWITPPGAVGRGNDKAKQGEKVVLHLHGGGYMRGHPLWFDCPHGIALTLGQRLFTMNYRKCLSPSTAFPAPLLDALAGYLHLTRTLGFPPENITLIGESAGGHLALTLSRYLADISLPQPGSMVLLSPWADFTMHPSRLAGSYVSYDACDVLIPRRLHMGIRSAVRYYTPESVKGPYFSPALSKGDEWKYLAKEGTRVLVFYGTKELFVDEDVALCAAMREGGVNLQVEQDIDGFHTRTAIAPEANAWFRQTLAAWAKQD